MLRTVRVAINPLLAEPAGVSQRSTIDRRRLDKPGNLLAILACLRCGSGTTSGDKGQHREGQSQAKTALDIPSMGNSAAGRMIAGQRPQRRSPPLCQRPPRPRH
jgi:hypothetical protein